MKIQLHFSLLVLSVYLIICQNVFAKDKPVPIFELKDTFFYDTNFSIKIYEDGKVHYRGNKVNNIHYKKMEQYVGVIGDRYAMLTKSQMEELVSSFRALLSKEAHNHITMVSPTVSTNSIHYKNGQDEIYVDSNLIFLEFSAKLNEFIEISKWVCFPKNYSTNYRCIIRDLPDDYEK